MTHIFKNKIYKKNISIWFSGGSDHLENRREFYRIHPKIIVSTAGRLRTHLSNGLFQRKPIKKIIINNTNRCSNDKLNDNMIKQYGQILKYF